MDKIPQELQDIINLLPDAIDGYDAKMFYGRLLDEDARLRRALERIRNQTPENEPLTKDYGNHAEYKHAVKLFMLGLIARGALDKK